MKTLILINKSAGSLTAETVEKSIRSLLKRHFPKHLPEVDVVISASPEEVHQLVHQHHETLETVVAVGGDGTVIEVISAVMAYPHIRVAIVPQGTGNRLASNLGLPPHIKGALEVALEGTPHAIDVGRINGRYFALMAGAGLDAEIMAGVQPIEKRTMGLFAYFVRGLGQVFQTPYAVFEIQVDDTTIKCRGIGVVVANAGNLLGRYFTLTPNARLDDGLFDVCVLGSKRRTDYWTTVIQILSRQERGIDQEGIRHIRGSHIVIHSRPQMKVQADGDVIGNTPIEITALPKAVQIMVPREKHQQQPLVNSIHHISDHLWMTFRDLLHF